MRPRYFLLRLLYDAVFLLVMVAGSPYFLYRLATASRFRAGLAQRFGFVPLRASGKPRLWVHGVSVGETKAARPFVERFSSRHPDVEVVVSNTTQGGHELAARFFPGLFRFFYPLDFSPIVRRVMSRIAPSGIVLMELEIWPNFLLEARRRGIPVFVVNGKLSPRSFRGYRRVRRCLPQFDWVNLYSVQNESFAGRFRDLGVGPDRIQVTGNVKFDEVAIAPRELPPDPEIAGILELRRGEKVLVGGSTHRGEEAALCRALRALRSGRGESPDSASLCPILVPRHPDRAAEVLDTAASEGFHPQRLSQVRRSRSPLPAGAVLVVDTIGELERFYAVADLVFVGGSLIPRGGHNVLEPAAMGKAVIVGPHTFNFVTEVALLAKGGALVQVADESGLVAAMGELLSNPAKRKAIGEKAVALIRQNQGATLRTVEAVEARLFGGSPRPSGRDFSVDPRVFAQ